MSTLLNKPLLWGYGEAASIFGLPPSDGIRTISTLVRSYNLTPKRTTSNRLVKGLDRADLEVLARALNKTLNWPDDATRPQVD